MMPGFGNADTFGGPIDTPNYSRMAGAGLRYNRFHVTALCSPTRAAVVAGISGWTWGDCCELRSLWVDFPSGTDVLWYRKRLNGRAEGH